MSETDDPGAAAPGAPPAEKSPDDRELDALAQLIAKWVGMSMRINRGNHSVKVFADAGLTIPQISALFVLTFEGPTSVTTLTERLDLSLSATSHLVQRLVEQGLVRRAEHAEDRRQKVLTLTPAGRAFVDKMMKARLKEFRASVEHVGVALRQELKNVVEKIVEELAWKCADHEPQFEKARLNFAGANLEGVSLAGRNLRGADFTGANLEGAVLTGADLVGARFSGANLEGAELAKANLSGARFDGANLEGASLPRTILDGASFEGCNLEGADLEKARLVGATLRGCNLEGAALAGAILDGAELTNSNLEGADLTNASLRGAELAGVNLEGAELEGAIFDEGTQNDAEDM